MQGINNSRKVPMTKTKEETSVHGVTLHLPAERRVGFGDRGRIPRRERPSARRVGGYAPSSPSSVFASFRSRVSNPSVNQPYT